MPRLIRVGGTEIRDYNALRMLADNLEQIERLQSVNRSIWRGLADATDEANTQPDPPKPNED